MPQGASRARLFQNHPHSKAQRSTPGLFFKNKLKKKKTIYYLLSASATFNHIRFYATKVKPKGADASFGSQWGRDPAPFTSHMSFKAGWTGTRNKLSGSVGINFTAEMYQKEILNAFPQSTHTLKLEAHNIQRPSFHSFSYDH